MIRKTLKLPAAKVRPTSDGRATALVERQRRSRRTTPPSSPAFRGLLSHLSLSGPFSRLLSSAPAPVLASVGASPVSRRPFSRLVSRGDRNGGVGVVTFWNDGSLVPAWLHRASSARGRRPDAPSIDTDARSDSDDGDRATTDDASLRFASLRFGRDAMTPPPRRPRTPHFVGGASHYDNTTADARCPQQPQQQQPTTTTPTRTPTTTSTIIPTIIPPPPPGVGARNPPHVEGARQRRVGPRDGERVGGLHAARVRQQGARKS